MMITLSDLPDFPSERNSQREILGFRVIYFQQRNFVHGQCCRKVRLTLQRNKVFIKAVWCCVLT